MEMTQARHPDLADETEEYFRSPPKFCDRRRHLGSVVPGRLFGRRCYYIFGPKGHEFVHVLARDKLLSGPAYEGVRASFGPEAIIAQDGPAWKLQHDLWIPIFSPKYLAYAFGIKKELYAKQIAQWPREGEIDLLHECTMLAIKGSLRALFGLDFEGILEEVRKCLITLGEVAFFTYGDPSTHPRASEARRRLLEILEPQIEAKRRNPGEDAMSRYVTGYDPPLTNEQVIGQAAGMMFAAHDTTKSMMSWSFYFMLKYQGYRQRVLEEIRTAVGDDLRFEHVSNLHRLPIMDNLIKEAERMYTPLHPQSRLAKEDLEFEGHKIPAGSLIQVVSFAAHYDPEIYEVPYLFDPDRFAPPREEHKKRPYSLHGFGGGERVCMGKPNARMDIKMALTLAFQNLDFELVDPEGVGVAWGPLTQPTNFRVTAGTRRRE
jgi:cytochrome P450